MALSLETEVMLAAAGFSISLRWADTYVRTLKPVSSRRSRAKIFLS